MWSKDLSYIICGICGFMVKGNAKGPACVYIYIMSTYFYTHNIQMDF